MTNLFKKAFQPFLQHALLLSSFALGLALFSTPKAHAFPEMVRHGYVNCTSCHLSPSGGGTLSPYGHQLSAELLSNTARENEAEFAYHAVQLPSWLSIGGDARGAEIYRNTPQVTANRYVFMQADLDAVAHQGNWSATLSAGLYQGTAQTRRHSILYQATDELSLRLGKFQQNFGIMNPSHTDLTKRALGWDENSETYNLEAAWLGDSLSAFLTFNLGRPDDLSLNREKGLAFRPTFTLQEHFQIGASYFHGVRNGVTRDLMGPFAVLGFTKKLYLLTELDFQFRNPDGDTSHSGFVNSQKLGYEFTKGLHFYLTQQAMHLDFQDASTVASSYGAGVQFFPRPHFEFDLEYQRQKSFGFPTDTLDFATLLIHFYI